MLNWTQETLADKARVSLTALKRLESKSDLDVYEPERDQVRRVRDAASIVLLANAKGEGVLLLRNPADENGSERPHR